MKIANAMKIVIATFLATVLLNVGCVEEDTVFVPEPEQVEDVASGREIDEDCDQDCIERHKRIQREAIERHEQENGPCNTIDGPAEWLFECFSEGDSIECCITCGHTPCSLLD